MRVEQIPKVFLTTDKVWSNRAADLNRSLATTHPSWGFRFYDDNAAIAFLQRHYGSRHVSTFRSFANGAHRADFFRYALLHADGGYYLDTDNRPLMNLQNITHGFSFVSVVGVEAEMDLRTGMPIRAVHNGFIAAKPRSSLTGLLLNHMMCHPKPPHSRFLKHNMYFFYVRMAYHILLKAANVSELKPNTPYTFAPTAERFVLTNATLAAPGETGYSSKVYSADSAIIICGVKSAKTPEGMAAVPQGQPNVGTGIGGKPACCANVSRSSANIKKLLGTALHSARARNGTLYEVVANDRPTSIAGRAMLSPAVDFSFGPTSEASRVAIIFSGELRGSSHHWETIRKQLVAPNQGAVFAAFWVSSLERATAFVAVFSPEKVRFMDGVESTKLLDAVQPGGAHAQHSFGTTVLPQYYAVALGFDLVRDTTHQLLVRARTDVLYSAPVIIADNTAAITVPLSVYERSPEDRSDYGTSCGRMPQDAFAYGPRSAMLVYAGLFSEANETQSFLVSQPGYRDLHTLTPQHGYLSSTGGYNWTHIGKTRFWQASLRAPGTFLNSNEAFLGHHLQRHGLQCELLKSRNGRFIQIQIIRA